jgi:tripartite-type tricarboxylate transporter receptor subunit TctC
VQHVDTWRRAGTALTLTLLLAACAPAAPASPTAAPAKPTEAPKPAATAAPAKAAEAKPAASPAAKVEAKAAEAKPAEAKPAPSPAAKSAEAKPAASPAAKPAAKPALSKAEGAAFDEKAVADFYRGKTLRIIVATTAGSLFDNWGRIMGRHMPKHIPGNPNIVVENMAGAGHVIGANHVFNVAPKDGTVFGTFVETQVINQMTGGQGIQFDMAKYNWLGSVSSSNIACLVRTDLAPVNSYQDMLKPDAREIVFATTGPGSSGYEYPLLMKELTGAKIKLVTGYPGNQEVRLAIEKGEAEGYCATWDAVKRSLEPWIQAGKPPYKIVAQEGKERHPDLKDVPLAQEFVKNADDKRILQILNVPNQYAKPYALPPGVPMDRVEALRAAFLASFNDPELKAEADKGQLEYSPSPGPELQAAFTDVLASPPAIVQRFRTLLGR